MLEFNLTRLHCHVHLLPCQKWVVQCSLLYYLVYTGQVTFNKVPKSVWQKGWVEYLLIYFFKYLIYIYIYNIYLKGVGSFRAIIIIIHIKWYKEAPRQVKVPWASYCFSIEKAGSLDFMPMIARSLINKDIENQKTMWGAQYQTLLTVTSIDKVSLIFRYYSTVIGLSTNLSTYV